MCGRRCVKFLRSEFHYSKLCFIHTDRTAFTYSPWLPHSWKVQWTFIAYRWLIFLYFLVWLIHSGVTWGSESGPKYLIYLTNWGFIIWNAYLLVAAVITTLNFILLNFIDEKQAKDLHNVDTDAEYVQSCCHSGTSAKSTWWDGILWVFFTVAAEFAFVILVLYWIVIDGLQFEDVNALNVHVHLINGIASLIDLWVTGIPLHLLHVVYVILLGSAYVTFSGIYYAANGTDPNGNPYIYEPLDYGARPGVAAGYAIGCGVFLLVVVHLLFFVQYLARQWITMHFYGRRRKYSLASSEHADLICDTPVQTVEESSVISTTV